MPAKFDRWTKSMRVKASTAKEKIEGRVASVELLSRFTTAEQS